MTIRWRVVVGLGSVALALGVGEPLRGQQPLARSVVASSGLAADAWAFRVDTMLRDGALGQGIRQEDTMIGDRVHERLPQQHLGLPVFGGGFVRQMDGRAVVSVFGRMFEGVSLPTLVPALSAGEAAAIAERAAGPGSAASDPVLGILPGVDRYTLVYRTTTRGPWNIRRYSVNARTGAIEDSVSLIRHLGPVIGRGTGVLSDDKKVSANQTSTGFEAVDILRPAPGFTLDFRGSLARFNSFLRTGLVSVSDIALSSANVWTDGAVVDAHVYLGWVYDYYAKRFGRRGLDDGDFEVINIVHPLARANASAVPPEIVGSFLNNAAYLHPGVMLFGDGDGFTFDYLAGSLDVVGHELTHGVTAFTSELDYRDEPGALNEAFSDIMGTAIEFFHIKAGAGPQKGPNFQVGEDVTRAAPGYVRSLQNPAEAGDPDHYSLRQFIGTTIDDGGVHVNATIVGHAFYLAVAGGRNRVSGITVQGVGLGNMERMERIFYRAFVFFLGPLSEFADARAATLQAAGDLYGPNSNERIQLEQAWTAVGVE